ncbi:MAG: hypothetical protein J6J42_03365 [Lachnospiraceae bacterium]|nr:hypothetical protein [Lachnospiraceae bacterium]
MNLTKFLAVVDEETNRLSKEQLCAFLHEYARILPETQREKFLFVLSQGSMTNPAKKSEVQYRGEKAGMEKRLAVLKEKLDLIAEGEWCLDSDYSPEYDEWYNSDEEEFLFSDPKGIMKILQEACELVHECVDKEFYREGLELAECLLALEIEVEGVYAEYDCGPLYLSDLNRAELFTYPLKILVKDAVFSAYQAVRLQDRAKEVYRILINSECRDVTLQDLFQMGKQELKDWKMFLEKWIEHLSTKMSCFDQVLIVEAVDMLNDFQKEWDYARKYKENHPELYEHLFYKKEYGNRQEDLLELGKEALNEIRGESQVRSRIALGLAELCSRNGKEKSVERCFLEAFRSDTTVVNFLRLYGESREFSKYAAEVEKIYAALLQGNRGKQKSSNPVFDFDSRKENTYYMLAFFHKQFSVVLDKGMDTRESLGWSLTFMKQGLSLFLLYLYQGDTLQAGGREMCRRIVTESGFDTKKYNEGLVDKRTEESEVLFWELFKKWKKENTISGDEQIKLIDSMKNLVNKRVKGIMEGNHRKYYDECAAFVAALGEAEESLGKRNGKADLLLSYKQMYSRRSAFHGELRRFGMKDGKR